MSHRLLVSVVLILSAEFSSVAAHTVDAERYVTAQGVEVIHGRNSNANGSEEKPAQMSKSKSGTRGVVDNNRSSARESDGEVRSVVPPKDQIDRDHDRLAILKQELKLELALFQSKTNILQTPSLKAKLGDDDLLRLRVVIADHEQNIRSLNAEIGRVRVAH